VLNREISSSDEDANDKSPAIMIIGRDGDGDERSRNKCSTNWNVQERHGANAIRRISEGYTDIADI
jgi:hypothetical protein